MRNSDLRLFLTLVFISHFFIFSFSQSFTLVELNCENLFDTRHDPLKQDTEFLPDGSRHWSSTKYWGKVNRLAQEVLSCSDDLPDLVALVEVENDSVLRDLTRRSLLHNAGYDYLMTESPDVRGIDVALLYQPSSFRPLCYETIEVQPLKGMRPTRDILYIKGLTRQTDDTLHIFVLHSPSMYGGERQTHPYRRQVVETLAKVMPNADSSSILVTGDFNDHADGPSLLVLYQHGLVNLTRKAQGHHGAKGTYRYQGRWLSIDHVLASPSMYQRLDSAYVNDAPFLLEDDSRYGGKRPRRTFQGYRSQRGFSDHLPLVTRFRLLTKVE